MNRISIFYVLTVLAVGAAIFGVLRLGSSLPQAGGALAEREVAAAALEAPPGAFGVFDGLRVNLEQPLARLFVQLLVIVAASQAFGCLFTRIGQPAVVGEMAAGIVLGPSLLGGLAPGAFAFVFPADSLEPLRLLSQIGVCFFMFATGMQVNVKRLKGTARSTVAVSHVSIVLPYLLGVLFAYAAYERIATPGTAFATFALFMGIAMSITAFPVLARILEERGLAHTALGGMAITCAAVDDVTAWSLLAFVVAVAGATDLTAAALGLVWVLVFIAVMVFGVRRALPGLLAHAVLAGREPSKSALAGVALLVVAAALCTEAIGVHALFGAFLAGAIMPEARELRTWIGVRLESFSSVLLLPLFFTFTGLRTQVGLLDGLDDWLLCLSIIGIASLGKLGGSAVAARVTGIGWRDSLRLGALMNTRGLMELVALNIGYDLGILSAEVFTMMVIMALVTTMLTGPLLTLFSRRSVAGVLEQPSSG